MRKKFYVTTPIYYVNDVPHIGHTCTTVVADIVARYHRQKGEDVFFLTGTDEHGAKVAEAAEKKGISPQKFCDQVSQRFQKAWKRLNISNDFFIRTTDPRHVKVVQEFLARIYQNGDIYKGKYEGFYCLGCERFLTEKELVNNRCPYHPTRKVSYQKEENYFFRLSKYTPKLIKLIENDRTNYIFPEGKRKEMLSKLKSGINDVSISREKVKWGISFPWDSQHTVYVWVDALINYYSATRFLPDKEKFWPADIHLIGKEILWFHTVIWPAMLLSAGIAIPQKVFAHSFYTIEGQKMSKSLGNVISPEQLVEKFGIDGTRYLIAASFPEEDDADVGWKKFTEKYNADLANGLGNLVSRVTKLAAREKLVVSLSNRQPAFIGSVAQKIEEIKLPEALFAIWNDKKAGVQAINKEFNENRVWEKKGKKLKKDLNQVIGEILTIADNIKPFMPQTAGKIEKIFTPGRVVENLKESLFPRIT
jgi:methionyl-tRNA synthetase